MSKILLAVLVLFLATAAQAQSEWIGLTRDSIMEVLSRRKAQSMYANGPLITAKNVRLLKRRHNVSIVINEDGKVAQVFTVTVSPMPYKVFRERMLRVTEGETISNVENDQQSLFGRRKGGVDDATIFDKRTRLVTNIITIRGANPVWSASESGIPGQTMPAMLHENEQKK